MQGEALEVDKRWIRLMKQQIQTAEVELIANFGTARVTFTDLLNMQVGDVIPLQTVSPVTAQVDGVPVMECSYGKLNGQYALRVEKLLSITQNETPESIQGEQHG
jgi:flagellar motor switch protein FliM